MNRNGREGDGRPADVLRRAHDPWNEHPKCSDRFRSSGNGIDHRARHDALLHGVLNVDRWRFSGDRDRFLKGTDPHVRIHCGGEGSWSARFLRVWPC